MLNKLKLEAETISLEASTPGSLFNAVDRLPGFINLVRQHFVSSVGEEAPVDVPPTYSKLAKQIAAVPYTSLMNLKIYTPPGLTIPYLDYLKSLEEAEAILLDLPKKVIGPFSFWISQLLTNPHEMSSVRNHLQIKDMHLPDVDKLNQLIMKGIVGSDKETQMTYGKMVRRNRDWGQIEAILEELNHRMVGTDRKRIIADVSALTDNMDTLIQRIQEDPEEYAFSPQALKLLSNTCYSVAKVLESYAVFNYQLHLTTVAIEDTQLFLKKIVQPKAA